MFWSATFNVTIKVAQLELVLNNSQSILWYLLLFFAASKWKKKLNFKFPLCRLRVCHNSCLFLCRSFALVRNGERKKTDDQSRTNKIVWWRTKKTLNQQLTCLKNNVEVEWPLFFVFRSSKTSYIIYVAQSRLKINQWLGGVLMCLNPVNGKIFFLTVH
jgi:hypothetical protein